MRKNKGFTLVELLAILVILGLIALATIPNISKQVKESEKQEQNVLDKKIENASKLYAAKYFADKIVKKEDFNFTLTDLENDGLLSLNDNQCSGKNSSGKKIKEVNYIKIEYDNVENAIKFNYEDISNDVDKTCHSCTNTDDNCIKWN